VNRGDGFGFCDVIVFHGRVHAFTYRPPGGCRLIGRVGYVMKRRGGESWLSARGDRAALDGVR
jgi:hypothetical protein